jgi:hypothetical protein
VEYNRSAEGKVKKAERNKNRSCAERSGSEKEQKAARERVVLDETIVRYLQMVLGWIEKREVSAREIVELVVRQHSIGKRKVELYAGREPARSRDGKKT